MGGNVAGMGAIKVCITFGLKIVKERNHSEDTGVDGRIILK
jgi:hypothetical protein